MAYGSNVTLHLIRLRILFNDKIESNGGKELAHILVSVTRQVNHCYKCRPHYIA